MGIVIVWRWPRAIDMSLLQKRDMSVGVVLCALGTRLSLCSGLVSVGLMLAVRTLLFCCYTSDRPCRGGLQHALPHLSDVAVASSPLNINLFGPPLQAGIGQDAQTGAQQTATGGAKDRAAPTAAGAWCM